MLPTDINPDKQKVSFNNLRGEILQNLTPNPQNDPRLTLINQFLENRATQFIEDIVKPLSELDQLNIGKVRWYFEIYKEGLEARKLKNSPFKFLQVDKKTIEELIQFYNERDLLSYCELGTSFNSNAYTLLSSWFRDVLVLQRLETVYSSDKPVDWILRLEKNDEELSQNVDYLDKVKIILGNIGFLMNKKI